MSIDYRLDLATDHLALALREQLPPDAEREVTAALALLREIKADLHRAPDPRQIPLR